MQWGWSDIETFYIKSVRCHMHAKYARFHSSKCDLSRRRSMLWRHSESEMANGSTWEVFPLVSASLLLWKKSTFITLSLLLPPRSKSYCFLFILQMAETRPRICRCWSKGPDTDPGRLSCCSLCRLSCSLQ